MDFCFIGLDIPLKRSFFVLPFTQLINRLYLQHGCKGENFLKMYLLVCNKNVNERLERLFI